MLFGDFIGGDAGDENAHRAGLVFVLAAFILTLHNSACRNVGDADSGIRFLDVLTAGARGAINVNAKIGRIDFNFSDFI